MDDPSGEKKGPVAPTVSVNSRSISPSAASDRTNIRRRPSPVLSATYASRAPSGETANDVSTRSSGRGTVNRTAGGDAGSEVHAIASNIAAIGTIDIIGRTK